MFPFLFFHREVAHTEETVRKNPIDWRALQKGLSRAAARR